MQLNRNFKLERLDSKNIALFKRFPYHKNKNRERWEPFRFYTTWEKAIKDSIEYLTLDRIDGVGDWSALVTAFNQARRDITLIAERLSLEMAEIEKEKRASAVTQKPGENIRRSKTCGKEFNHDKTNINQ